MAQLSALDINYIVKELQNLIGGKIEKIHQQEKPRDEFLLNIHIPSKGKTLVYITLPQTIAIADFKPSFPNTPPSFCSSLRRKITNARIKSITQHEFDRIIIFELSTKQGESKLIIELFSSGNIILIDEDDKILSTLHPKIYSEERKILPGKKYAFPKSQTNVLKISKKEFEECLTESTKDKIVTSLAIDCSLGGLYAEELLHLTKIDKNDDPRKLKQEQKDDLFKKLKELLNSEAKANRCGKIAVPINIKHLECTPSTKSFGQLLAEDTLSNLEKSEETQANKEKKELLSKVQKIIRSQKQQIKGLEKAEEENTKKGEFIYTHYSEIDKLLKSIREKRKTKTWDEIKKEMEKTPYFVNLDEHEGRITIEINEGLETDNE